MKRVIKILAAALGFVLAALFLWPAPAPISHVYFQDTRASGPEIIAHGGGQGHAPPNTLLALERAAAMGADVLEVDLQQTRDGILVLRHDDTLDRTTNRTGLIADLTWAEISDADAGAPWTLEGESFGDRGITIPTLEAAFAAFPNARWVMEIKNDTPRAAVAMCEAIQAADAEHRVLIASFHDDAMKVFRGACPRVATSTSSGESRTFILAARLGLSRHVSTPAVALQIPVRAGGLDLTHPRIIAAAKARGLKIQYWTINDRAEILALLEAGADGVMTDYVDRGTAARNELSD